MFGVITCQSELACHSKPGKTSLMIGQSFGVQIVCICPTVFETTRKGCSWTLSSSLLEQPLQDPRAVMFIEITYKKGALVLKPGQVPQQVTTLDLCLYLKLIWCLTQVLKTRVPLFCEFSTIFGLCMRMKKERKKKSKIEIFLFTFEPGQALH